MVLELKIINKQNHTNMNIIQKISLKVLEIKREMKIHFQEKVIKEIDLKNNKS